MFFFPHEIFYGSFSFSLRVLPVGLPVWYRAVEWQPVCLRTGYPVVGTRNRRNHNNCLGPTLGSRVFLPRVPAICAIYMEPPRLAYALMYTCTAATVALDFRLSPLQATDRKKGKHLNLRWYSTLHTRYPDQRKRP